MLLANRKTLCQTLSAEFTYQLLLHLDGQDSGCSLTPSQRLVAYRVKLRIERNGNYMLYAYIENPSNLRKPHKEED